jgi:hypothetical protein
MNNAIVFTPAEATQVILTIAGFIVAINAAALVIISWWNNLRKPETLQNERIENLEIAVKSLSEEIPKMKEAYHKKSSELAEYESDNRNFQRVIIKSLQALTEHAINGDNEDQLRSAIESLNNYLVDK